jgi:predicted permease
MIRWIRRFVSATLARARFEREMRRELGTHIELRADDLERSGLSRDEALRHARVEFGGIERYKEACRDARGFAAFRPLHGLLYDLKVAFRRLAATPLFFIFGVLSLATGLAVVTAVYSLLYMIFWQPSGLAEPDRIVVVGTGVEGSWQARVSMPDAEDLRASVPSLGAIAGSHPTARALEGQDVTEIVSIEAVTGSYFDILGIRPHRGRFLNETDAHARAIVISHDAWRKLFKEDPAVIGRAVRLGGQAFEVVGVAPKPFTGLGAPMRATGVWIPFESRLAFTTTRLEPDRGRATISVVGRLASAVSLQSAAAEIETVSARLDSEHPLTRARADGSRERIVRGWRPRILDEARGGASESYAAMLILALVCLVLVGACTNLANLTLARGNARTREIAIRRALGASRWRLVRELTLESAIVGLGGALTGLLLTKALLAAASVNVPLPRGVYEITPPLNLPVMLAAFGAAVLSILVFGLEPAIRLTRTVRLPEITTGENAVGAERSKRQWALIRWQVAISVTFFLVAAILARAILADARHDPGVDVDRLALASVHVGLQGWSEERGRRVLERALEEIRREPGIEAAALSTGTHFGSTMTLYAYLTTPDKPFAEGKSFNSDQYLGVYLLSATPEVFRTFGVPIVQGRGFNDRDDAGANPVVVISEHTARKMFGTVDAVGRTVLVQTRPGYAMNVGTKTATVVGVARDTDVSRPLRREYGLIYLPFAQHYEPNVMLVARTSGRPEGAVRQIEAAVRRADPELALGTAGPATMMMAGMFLMARVASGLATALGLMTLVLAMVGLYGVLATVVQRRTREVGLRMALGAAANQIHGMVLKQGFKPVVQGLILGLLFGCLARFALKGVINSAVEVFDPLAMLLVPVPLALAAFAACYLPARRAARVNPNVALREL